MAWMDEDDSIPLVELRPDGFEVLVTEILAVIGSEQRDAISLQLVKRILQGFDRALDIREAWQGTEKTKLVRLLGADGRGVIVPFVSEGATGCGVAFGGRACNFGAWSGEGEDGG